MREFITAAEEDFNPDAGTIDIVIDGEELTFFEPSSAQQVVMLGMPRDKDDHRAVRNFLSLFFEMAEDDTREYLEGRLLDRKDHFDLPHIFQIFEGLVEEWSARPTKEPSGSRASRRATGSTSTAKRASRASTSSASRSRASSRSSSTRSAVTETN